MDISSVTNSIGVQYEAKNTSSKKEGLATDPNNKDLGVIVEVSKDSELAAKMADAVSRRSRTYDTPTRRVIYGNSVSANGMVSFYGANVTKEQSEKLQSIITKLEELGYVKQAAKADGIYQAGEEAIGNSFEPGTYAQLGLKVSQLSYACREIGLSEAVTKQITATYSKQAKNKMNRANGLIDALKTQMGEQKQKLYQMIREKGSNGAYERYEQAAQGRAGEKDSVEANQEINTDIYKMFANLDTGSKEIFQSSFQNALTEFQTYFADSPIENYTGTEKEQIQLNELLKRFHSFLNIM